MTADAAPSPFAVVSGREKGYDRDSVDRFLARAREAFENPDAETAEEIDAEAVRGISFPLVRGGYRIAPVDAALTRVEDAFAARERERAIRVQGAEAWVAGAKESAQVVLDRLSRPETERFDRVGLLRFGYLCEEVDVVADRITDHLARGDALSVDQVRRTAFRMGRNGYREEQVDAVLDAVIEVMLAVR